MNEYQRVLKELEGQPLPEIGVEFTHPASPWYKPIILSVLEYSDGMGTVHTKHSNTQMRKTEHWIRKIYYKSKQPKG